jgi:hypothetical protein
MFDTMRDLDAAELVAVVESTHRDESTLMARRMAAVAALLRNRTAAAKRAEDERGYVEIDGFDQARAEVAAAMNLSPSAAGYVVSDAEALDTRLPKIAALLAEGRVDWRTVRLIISRTGLIFDARLIAKLDKSLAERIGNWRGWSRQRIINEVDAAVTKLDPDAVRESRVAAENDRHIGVAPLENGMAEVYGKVSADVGTAFDQGLSQLAKQVCASDPRTMDQRRADALGALVQNRRLVCGCGKLGCAASSEETERVSGGARVAINVVAGEQTVYGNSEQPGYLVGYGVIDAEQVRQLVATAALHAIDPYTTPAQALNYQPPTALVRAVQSRDLTCRFPGCSRSAVRCDIDHTIPFNHQDPAAGGQTVFENLKCLCRLHHSLKTFGGWRDRQLADGTVIWTSPTRHTYTTSPGGADLFPELGKPACAPPIPNRRSRSQQRCSRIVRARKHNREQRPINEQRRLLEQARKQEIADRRFRNQMRDMLFIFKGAPSASPFSTWVNEPRESEELPADWTPDRSLIEQLPDDPPF